MVRSEVTPPVLQIPRQLIVLPERYSDLVKQASTFQCPQRSDGREYSDDGQAAMLCLVCGEMLCTNSYCCQKVVEIEGEERNEEDKIRIGGFTQHAQRFATQKLIFLGECQTNCHQTCTLYLFSLSTFARVLPYAAKFTLLISMPVIAYSLIDVSHDFFLSFQLWCWSWHGSVDTGVIRGTTRCH